MRGGRRIGGGSHGSRCLFDNPLVVTKRRGKLAPYAETAAYCLLRTAYFPRRFLRPQMLIQPNGFRVGERRRWQRLAVVDQPGVGAALVHSRDHPGEVQRRVGVRLKKRHGNRRQLVAKLNGPHLDMGTPVDAAKGHM